MRTARTRSSCSPGFRVTGMILGLRLRMAWSTAAIAIGLTLAMSAGSKAEQASYASAEDAVTGLVEACSLQ